MKFNQFLIKKSSRAYKFLIILGLAASLAGCEWGDQIESIVQPNPDNFSVLFSDTASVMISSVGSDSVMTGAPSRLLVGRYMDPYFGKIQASTFFQPTTNSGISVPETAVYDSLILALRYDQYVYGDTTKPMNLSVHTLQQDITDKNSYYNHDTTPFDILPIAKVKVVPRPRTKPWLKIKLSDVLGKDLFSKGQNKLINNNNDWINIVKGLLVAPGATDNGPVVGFRLDSASVQLHYHVQEVDGVRKDSTVLNTTARYNQILADRAGTQLAKLPSGRLALPASQSGNMSFIEGGVGVMTRVDFPYVDQLKYDQFTVVNRAFLRVEPLRASLTDMLPAPNALYVYLCDKNNQVYTNASDGLATPLYQITNTGSQAVAGTLVNDLLNNRQYYLFDVTTFVTSLLTTGTSDGSGLLLRTSPFSTASVAYLEAGTEFGKSVTRLVIGSQQNAQPGVKLELYYTNVKVDQ
ncbi:DUF4270 family protein [Dyadobacter sandarakinus]|uniref:DUF4270 family protein n=1 Tax=Dyadobacter sandarakinus TaxID=2747268 RepID=A0ABX7I0T3_9BACT|nr:DUF4270 family protein [Dyadobacter sandarakinus]QRQ99437.1 DUF4270 family protein [Dyadobacter sandarakinus]